MSKPTDFDFGAKLAELEKVLEWFESDDIDLDKAIAQYELGVQISQELQDYLKKMENKVKVIKAKSSSADSVA